MSQQHATHRDFEIEATDLPRHQVDTPIPQFPRYEAPVAVSDRLSSIDSRIGAVEHSGLADV